MTGADRFLARRLLAEAWSIVTLGVLAMLLVSPANPSPAPATLLVPRLESEFGLTEQQVRGALGALLVFTRERLPKPQFDELAARIPNADQIMQDVKARGIVTRPLDRIEDYEKSLASLGIGQPLASQFAPAVVRYLGEAGFHRERDMLARVLD